MTFVIAKVIDRDAGKVTLLSDTKITDQNDDTSNRQTLSNPGQKVVIVDDDVVVGFAGDTPASAVNRVAELRGRSNDGIEDALRSLSAEMHETAGASKSFLVVARKPTPRITVISHGEQEDRTAIQTGWIGDRQAFSAFSEVFQDPSAPADLELENRFFTAMTTLIAWEDVETVGGYLVRVSGRNGKTLSLHARYSRHDARRHPRHHCSETGRAGHPNGLLGRRSRSHSPCPVAHSGNWVDL